MSGQWADSDRRERLPSNWNSLVKQVMQRDGGRCRWRLPSGKRCPRRATDVDHRVRGDDHSLANLQALCPDHHKAKTAREAAAGRRAKRRIVPRRVEKQPGRLR